MKRLLALLMPTCLTLATLVWAPVASAAPFRDCADCPEMVVIPGQNFAIGKYLVTFAQWDVCVANGGCNGYRPHDYGWGRGTSPVINVSWEDAKAYIAWLSAKTGEQYRLPTEVEWEYACYGGSQTDYCGGNDINAVAWYHDNSGGQTHPVGQKQANGYGLYDMSGNVWERTADCINGDCTYRAIRGGSWNDRPQNVRATFAASPLSSARVDSLGFRLARTLP